MIPSPVLVFAHTKKGRACSKSKTRPLWGSRSKRWTVAIDLETDRSRPEYLLPNYYFVFNQRAFTPQCGGDVCGISPRAIQLWPGSVAERVLAGHASPKVPRTVPSPPDTARPPARFHDSAKNFASRAIRPKTRPSPNQQPHTQPSE